MAIGNIQAPTCALCGDVIIVNEPVYTCDTCGKVHHVYCWERVYRCSTPDCAGSPSAPQVIVKEAVPESPAGSPANSCPVCQYILSPIDEECPRCANLLSRGIDPGIYSRHLGNNIPGFSEAPIVPPTPYGSRADGADIDRELAQWNWGAFLLPLFWSAAMNLWGWFIVSLIVPLIASIFLGLRGNALAWGSRHWVDINHFRDTQRVWMKWGIGITIACILLFLIGFIAAIIIPMMLMQGAMHMPPPPPR